MPGIRFPTAELLQFAIRQGLLPAETRSIPVAGGAADDGSVSLFWHELPRKASFETLESVGATRFGAPPRGIRPLATPAEAIPLIPDPTDPSTHDADGPAVLFEFDSSEGFAAAAGEALRLGGDRIDFAATFDPRLDRRRLFLRAIRPSYYVLQRALEGDFGAVSIRTERSPRLWAPLGWKHPLEDLLAPAAGAWTLIGLDRPWETLAEPPMTDLLDAAELTTPRDREALVPIEPPPRLRTPIRLVASGADEAPEFWTLRGDAVDRLHRFVQEHEQTLAGRLSFAVTNEAEPTVILRARPNPEGPPTLGIDAAPYRSYLRISNLFVPCGRQLRPRLRPDVVATRLAPEQDETTWLEPTDDGGFVPRTLPESGFRPLEEWIEYYLQRERESLDAWVRATTFEFEPFVCRDDLAPGVPRPQDTEPRAPRKTPFDDLLASRPAGTKASASKRRDPESPSDGGAFFARDVDRDRTLRRLHEVEEAFLAMTGPLDGEDRGAAWAEMSRLHFALARPHDAFVCWTAAAWRSEALSPSDAKLLVEGLSLTDGALATGDPARGDDAASPSADRARSLAAIGIVAGAEGPSFEPFRRSLRERLQRYVADLEASEPYLPARAIWLAWLGVDAVAGEDVVRTALARDRILRRLHRDGLRWDLDVAGFLRRTRQNDAERARELSEQVERVRTAFGKWLDAILTKDESKETPRRARSGDGEESKKGVLATLDYARLIFAYADAALGHRERAEQALAEATHRLRSTRDVVHRWLADAFEFRVREAFEGRRSSERFPPALFERLEQMGQTEKYAVNRLRAKLKILEPAETVKEFALWHGPSGGKDWRVQWEIDIANAMQRPRRDARLQAIRDLWDEASRRTGDERQGARVRALAAAISIGPDIGAAQTDWFLKFLPELFSADPPLEYLVRLWAPTVRTGAHFGRHDIVQGVVRDFETVLREIASADQLIVIEPLIGEIFQDMRRFGEQAEVGRLFEAASEAAKRVNRGATPTPRARTSRGPQASRSPQERALANEGVLHGFRLELQIARGRFYFGQNDSAERTLDEIERTLEKMDLNPMKRAELMQAYLQALSEAPSSVLLARVSRMFRVDAGGNAAIPLSDDAARSTDRHFRILPVMIADALVRAMLSGDPTQSRESRRFVEEDEFYFRDRVHRDLAARLRRAGVE